MLFIRCATELTGCRVRKEPFDRQSWRAGLDPWCRRWLSAGVVKVRFVAGWQAAVVGVELDDGREVVVKIRDPVAGLGERLRCQARLWSAGFPCPRPLTGLQPFGPLLASAESLVPVQTGRPVTAAEMPAVAAALVGLVRRATAGWGGEPLGSPPDWAGWDRVSAASRWPRPGRGEVDLNASREPGWLRDLVVVAGARLRASTLPRVVGHVDWEPSNLGWTGDAITAVYDWDSLTVLSEAAVAGLAAAVHPVLDDGAGASVAQTAAFLTAYADARHVPWTAEEAGVAWAAGIWVLAYNAKGEAVDGIHGPVTDHLLSGLQSRRGRAGLDRR